MVQEKQRKASPAAKQGRKAQRANSSTSEKEKTKAKNAHRSCPRIASAERMDNLQTRLQDYST